MSDGFEQGLAAYEHEDYAHALSIWKPLAEAGDVDAQYMVGLFYEYGFSVKQDYKLAARWYKAAADQRDPWSEDALGLLYEAGKGVAQSYKEALYYYRLAADQGLADAFLNMGLMFEKGLGMKANDKLAAEYYLAAATAGDAYGAYNYARMLEAGAGAGVTADPYRAYVYYGVAAARFDSDSAAEPREIAVKARLELKQRLTAQQIASADEDARRILAATETTPDDGAKQSTGTGKAAEVGKPPGGEAAVPAPVEMASPQPEYYRSELVRQLQEALAALGFDSGPADGTFGPQTQAAVRAYQRSAGLPADGTISQELFDSIERALAENGSEIAALPPGEDGGGHAPASAEPDATGTGFVLNDHGHVLTNFHVINGCQLIRAQLPGEPIGSAPIVATDRGNDLAVLKLTGATPDHASFRDGPSIRQADSVVAVGYPLVGLLSSQAKVTTGTVNALAGLDNDSRFLQMSAPVQPGNSGGPLLDLSGNVVGVVDAKLDAVAVVEATGDIPQNVNFAIKAAVARSFLEANDIPYAVAPSTADLAPADVAELARRFTVLIECFE